MGRLGAPVRLASSPEERQAIYALRYRIFANDPGLDPASVRHDLQQVFDVEDEHPASVHYYVGKHRQPRGAVRVTVFQPGEAPAAYAAQRALDRIPGVDRMRTAEVGRYVVEPGDRSRRVLPALAFRVYEAMAVELDVQLAFTLCRPGLVKYYRRLGCRPYGAPLVRTPVGLAVPLVSVLADVDYFRAAGAITLPLVEEVFGPGGRTPPDLSPLAPLFEDDEREAAAWQVGEPTEEAPALRTDLLREIPLFEGLSEPSLALLARGSLVVDVAPGQQPVVRGTREREVFVVLEGQLGVYAKGRLVRALAPGEVFGEVGFFRDSGVRTADVRALSPVRLLSLDRRFLDHMRREDPDAAFTLLFNLGRVLAERLAQVLTV